MKSRYAGGTMVITLGTWWAWLAHSPANKQPLPPPQQQHAPAESRFPNTSRPGFASGATVLESGEANSRAIDRLVAATKASEQLSPADIQSLLAFICSPKPGKLTDGEWEERVNVILNLLRRQTEDFETEDRRQEGAGSLASSLAADGNIPPPLHAETAVPGLTEVLLEMAEKNPSKVLRLYAMQHLSLWFAEEGDAAKRRAMVGLLEKLATRPGDETAGCAVLMLGDMRRETEDAETEDRRQEGAGSLASSLAGRGVTTAATGDGIDWGRVDRVLEVESRRLVGEAGAGADVRISAVHACVDRKDAGALPDLRKIASDPAQAATLRKAAIHGIGQLGAAEDLAVLDALPQDDRNLSLALGPARIALANKTAAE